MYEAHRVNDQRAFAPISTEYLFLSKMQMYVCVKLCKTVRILTF